VANLNITNIPAPRVPFIDERTGLMAREWYRFFLNLFVLTGSGNNPITLEELQLGPPNQPDLAELLIQINQNIAPQYEDQSGDFLATLDTAQLMSMMSRFENAEAAIQGAYLQPVVQTGTIANYNLDGSPTAGGIAYGTGPALAVSAAGSSGQVLTSAAAGTPTWTTPTTGTVTAVSVVSANGLAGTSSGGATPALTLSTTVTGVVKGNGTALSAAVAATDYVAPSAYASANGLTMATARLLGRTTASTGAAEEISVAGGLTLSAGILTGASGTVTSVTGTSPVVSSGGATPAISMPAATTSVNGYLTSTDWTTFNNKGSGTVTSVTGTAPVVSSGGATPAISMAAATTSVNGYLTSTDWNTFNGKGSGTVTSVAALTLGTTGTDLSSTVANGTTTPVITLQVPTASASNRGALSSTDWTTFNNKGSGTVTSVGGTGTVNGLTLTGTVTTTGSLTLGGTLDLSSPPAIGATSPSTGKFTTLTSTSDANLHGLTVGLGAGSVATNAAAGTSALGANTTGSHHVAVGYQALFTNTNSADVTAVGYKAGYTINGSNGGTFVGSEAGTLATGAYNTCFGVRAGKAISSGGGNTFLGASSATGDGAGAAVTTGGNNTLVGGYAGTAALTGYVVLSDGSGNIRLSFDGSGIATMPAYGVGSATFSATGVISSVSDETWKTKDGVPTNPDSMLNKLAPGYWYYNDEKKETFGTERQLGFYAQNVNAAIGSEAAPEPEEGKPWGYYDRSVLAVVVMSLQNALATIELLNNRLALLESK